MLHFFGYQTYRVMEIQKKNVAFFWLLDLQGYGLIGYRFRYKHHVSFKISRQNQHFSSKSHVKNVTFFFQHITLKTPSLFQISYSTQYAYLSKYNVQNIPCFSKHHTQNSTFSSEYHTKNIMFPARIQHKNIKFFDKISH